MQYNPFPSPATIMGEQRLSGSCSSMEMVQLYTGNLFCRYAVVNIATVGMPLVFSLMYNSQAPDAGPVGCWRHNYMMRLTFLTGRLTFVSESGREYVYEYDSLHSKWTPACDSFFFAGTPSQDVSDETIWRMTMPGGDYMTFKVDATDSSIANLIELVDARGFSTTLAYDVDGRLTTITDPSGNRSIELEYAESAPYLLTHIIDPRGQDPADSYSTLLSYDDDNNLVAITSPELCVTQYAYGDTPSDHRISLRRDPNGHEMRFWYTQNAADPVSFTDLPCPRSFTDDPLGGLYQLTGVSDPDGRHIAYSYTFALEATNDHDSGTCFNRTILTDARSTEGNQIHWEYRFDSDGNLWRIIDPLGHWFHFRWDDDQQLMYSTGPFLWPGDDGGPRDNPLNTLIQRNAYDLASWDAARNLIYTTDGSGLTHHLVYDEKNHVTDVFNGQGHVGIQGNWTDHFGKEGYVLCAFDDSSGDRYHLPDYIDSTIAGTFSRAHGVASGLAEWKHLIDPRVPVAADSLTKGIGFWTHDSAFEFTLALAEGAGTERKFNLSIYTHCADMNYQNDLEPGGPEVVSPLTYSEQFGRDITIQVHHADDETQSYRVYNNAPGVWVTFPIVISSTVPATVTVSANHANTVASISAICFDPYENRHARFGYDEDNIKLTSVQDGLGNTVALSYVSNLLDAVTDARGNMTHFSYDSTYLDLASITDRSGQSWAMAYDANGNLVGVTDPLSHSVAYAYDKKNRITAMTDALLHTTAIAYDAAGNVVEIEDANHNIAQFEYGPMNRLRKIIDPLLQETSFEYDAAGNLISMTDAKSNMTTFGIDDASRVTAVHFPDIDPGGVDERTHLKMAYDGLSRLVAVTTPNGNQNDLSATNVLNALNLLKNPGAEVGDPTSPSKAVFWDGTSDGTVVRDGSTHSPGARSGDYSFQTEVSGTARRWEQRNVPLPAGATALLNGWAMSDGSPSATIYANVFGLDGQTHPEASTTAISGAPYTWTALGPARFDVPGDAQYRDVPVNAVGAQFNTTSGSATVWGDDLSLYSLSTSASHDGAGRPVLIQSPDGARAVTSYDRLGRASRIVDPKGRAWKLEYDALDRVTKAVDPRGGAMSFEYDQNGNVTSFQDANGNITAYGYDEQDRLESITHPDLTLETMTWDEAGRVETYTNSRGELNTYAYDAANRLISIAYPDDTTVLFGYDDADNLNSKTERNGDVTTYLRDRLYRVTDEKRTRPLGLSGRWAHNHAYDPNSNRVAFNDFDGADYDAGRFNRASFGASEWTTAGYDSMDRLTSYHDRSGNQTDFKYDIESRVKSVTFPNGLITTPTYDVQSRVVDLNTTTTDGTPVLTMSNGYDLNSNRNSLVVDNDTFDYGLDESDQLVEEAVNRFVERRYEHFQQGSVSGLQLDASGTLSLLPFDDDFSADAINADRWRLFASSLSVANFKVQQKVGLQADFITTGGLNDGLIMAYPSGYTNRVAYNLPVPSSTYNEYGFLSSNFWVNLQHNTTLTGDFQVAVDFLDAQTYSFSDGEVLMGLMISDAPFPTAPANCVSVSRGVVANAQSYVSRAVLGGTPQSPLAPTTTTDINGKLRITASGGTVTTEFWDGSDWQPLESYTLSTSATVYVSLHYHNTHGLGSIRWQNFTADVETYPAEGVYTSRVYDTGADPGRTVTWSAIQAETTVPTGCSVSLGVASSASQNGPWSYASLGTPITGRYARYQATFDGTGAATPSLTRVDLVYDGTSPSTSKVYAYDPNGNLTNVETRTWNSGTSSDDVLVDKRDDAGWTSGQRVNNLNQIKHREVALNSTSTAAYDYTYDDSGNMTAKTDGTNTWAYQWDEDNRLLQVTLPDEATVRYTYDGAGRMMTRAHSVNGMTAFEWDGFDCVREYHFTNPLYGSANYGSDNYGEPEVTRYFVVNGVLMSFERGGVTYQVHADALGHVRLVTDPSGASVYSASYDAWGDLLATSYDDVPGGFQYGFVGAYGCGADVDISLVYMRQRWYATDLQRFISRDIIRSSNRYAYCTNKPTVLLDPQGLDPTAPFDPTSNPNGTLNMGNGTLGSVDLNNRDVTKAFSQHDIDCMSTGLSNIGSIAILAAGFVVPAIGVATSLYDISQNGLSIQNVVGLIPAIATTMRRLPATTWVYRVKDATQTTRYVGITDDLSVRWAKHLLSESQGMRAFARSPDYTPIVTLQRVLPFRLPRPLARGVEQALIERHGLLYRNIGGTLYNGRNEISPDHYNYILVPVGDLILNAVGYR